jgi:D-alanyl-D-alanine carboxypeptidase
MARLWLLVGPTCLAAATLLPMRTEARAKAHFHGPVRAAIVIDADTGGVLSQASADARAYPASLTKLMTLYLTFRALNRGQLRLNQRLYVSRFAARQQPTKLWLKAGSRVRVRDLILGIVTVSANDAAVVLAQGIAGSESAFAKRMTATARRLGMTRTVYHNASGLPDPRQHTTARDIARLSLALVHHFPREYRYFSVRSFRFHGRIIPGHDHLLTSYPGCDGLKTGFTDASGFNLASSAVRDGHRLIGVVLGGPTYQARDAEMAALLDRGFAKLHREPDRMIVAAGHSHSSDKISPGVTATITGAAFRLAADLAPIRAAEAAPSPTGRASPRCKAATPSARSWAVQLGAFRGREMAERIARRAHHLAIARDRRVTVVGLRGTKHLLYRTRIVAFTKCGAVAACNRVRANRLPCAPVLIRASGQ